MKLDRRDFEYREWVALSYAREWTFLKGGEVSGEAGDAFRGQYSAAEQGMILKLMRTMLFANYCGNGYYKRPWRSGDEHAQVCSLPISQPDAERDL